VPQIRLQKVLADSGVASRRACEKLILDGKVKVDGKVIRVLGSKIDPEISKVSVEGKSIDLKKTNLYIAFNKPRGVLSTMSDPSSRPSLGDYFPADDHRLFHVGRLDKESEGLIILTNDGAWAQRLLHPSFEIKKRYFVVTDRKIRREEAERLLNGVRIEGGIAKAITARSIGDGIEIEIHEGRNQVIRKMIAALGLEVLMLRRTRVGKIELGELPSGKWRHLSSVELL
jgi:23S rRNA pseudouridine2605 synthase